MLAWGHHKAPTCEVVGGQQLLGLALRHCLDEAPLHLLLLLQQRCCWGLPIATAGAECWLAACCLSVSAFGMGWPPQPQAQ